MPAGTRQTVERFWATANARDWPAFAELLHPDLVYRVPQTRERAEGADALVDTFRTWPGEWVVHIEQLIADAGHAVSTISFQDGEERMTGISFFDLSDGRISAITDWWPSPYEPPPRVSAQLVRAP
jgi:ketosteroid isomerase-like protein